MLTVSDGWRLFLKAFKASKRGDVGLAAEWMYRLNVFARSVGRVAITEQIYSVKNDFIRYLYQHGYATQVSVHKQEFECWGGINSYCDEDCQKCGGTGVYRTVKLYSFRFLVNDLHYSWHQPTALVDYPVEDFSTHPEAFDFGSLPKDEAILSMNDAWLGCCVVWWCLALHGINSDLILWRSTRNMIFKKTGIESALRELRIFKTRVRYNLRRAVERLDDLREKVFGKKPVVEEYPIDYDDFPF